MATKPTAPTATEVAVVPPKSTAVAMPGNWRDRMKSVTVKVAEAEKPTGGFISFKAGRLSIGDQLMKDDKIEVVVIDYLVHNKYFDIPYNANKASSPACYAFGRVEEDLEPEEGAEDPQADMCAECPQNEWGSAGGGSKGKACTNSRRLWLLPAGVITDPGKAARTDALQCDLPATSIKNFSKFVMDTAQDLGVPPFGVVVEMSVKPHPTSLFQVHFKPMEQIKDEAILEQLALRQYKMEQDPHPVYPTREEMAERQSSGKY